MQYMGAFLKKIDLSDIFMLLGCILMGYGLFLVFGLGWSLIGSGLTLGSIGFFGSSKKGA